MSCHVEVCELVVAEGVMREQDVKEGTTKMFSRGRLRPDPFTPRNTKYHQVLFYMDTSNTHAVLTISDETPPNTTKCR